MLEVFVLFGWIDGRPVPSAAYSTYEECWTMAEYYEETIEGLDSAECRRATLAMPIQMPSTAG